MSLLWAPSEERCREARPLLQDLLNASVLSTAQRQLYISELTSALHNWPESAKDPETAHSMLDQIYEESEAEGGKEYRRLNWPLRVWTQVTDTCPGQTNRETLAIEFGEAMALSVGTSHYFYIAARLRRADILQEQGRYLEAEEIFSACVSALEQRGARENLLELALEGLASSYVRLGRLTDTIPLMAKSIGNRLQAPESDWAVLEDLADHLASALENVQSYKAMVSVTALRLHFVEKLASLDAETVTERTVLANYQAFTAKSNTRCEHGHTPFKADKAVDHLNAAIVALVTESQRQTQTDQRDSPPSSPQNSTSSAERPNQPQPSTFPISAGGWYIFDLLLEKAIELSKSRLHDLAAESFLQSMFEFEACSSIDESDSWYYIDRVWIFLDWAVEGPQHLVRTPVMISWACKQARSRFGNLDATRDQIRRGISARRDLLEYLPGDEIYTVGLVQVAPATASQPEAGSSDQATSDSPQSVLLLSREIEENGPKRSRVGSKPAAWLAKRRERKLEKSERFDFSKGPKVPFRQGHRRQFSAERGLKPALSVAVAVGAMTVYRDGPLGSSEVL